MTCSVSIDLQNHGLHVMLTPVRHSARSKGPWMHHYDAQSEDAIVEVKSGVSGMRDVRAKLAELAGDLVEHPWRRAYLVLVDPRVSGASIASEFERLMAAMRQDVAGRLYVVAASGGDVHALPRAVPAEDWPLIRRTIEDAQDARPVLSQPDMQSEVIRVLLLQWVFAGQPVSPTWVQETVGCAYRTVMNAVDRLGPVVERGSNGSIQLRAFPVHVWPEIVVDAPRSRSTMLFADQSGQPRSPDSLLRRLERLDRENVAIGGVLGARHFMPDLDMVGAPRLDLTVHAPTGLAELELAEQLDPGLAPAEPHGRPPRLALHFLRRQEPFFAEGEDRVRWADPIECLLDLYEAGLDQPARQLQRHMETPGRMSQW